MARILVGQVQKLTAGWGIAPDPAAMIFPPVGINM